MIELDQFMLADLCESYVARHDVREGLLLIEAAMIDDDFIISIYGLMHLTGNQGDYVVFVEDGCFVLPGKVFESNYVRTEFSTKYTQ